MTWHRKWKKKPDRPKTTWRRELLQELEGKKISYLSHASNHTKSKEDSGESEEEINGSDDDEFQLSSKLICAWMHIGKKIYTSKTIQTFTGISFVSSIIAIL